MQPLFEADTVFTFEVYEKFGKATVRKNKPILFCWLVLAILWLLLIVEGIVEGHGAFALLILLIMIAAPFILRYCIKRQRQKMWESSKAMQNARVHYAFYEDHVEQNSDAGSAKYSYDQLYRIWETEDAFYLMVSANQGLIVDKSGCSEALCDFVRGIRTK